MIFYVIDKKTGKEPTNRMITNIARKGRLMEKDIDEFYISEEGFLILMDDCGKSTPIDQERFKVVFERDEPRSVNYSGDGYADGEMVYDMAECMNCGREFEYGDETWGCKFCPDCGQALKWEGDQE